MTGHTFITHLCECIGDCVPVCPVECIHSGTTAESRRFSRIDDSRCIDCGACHSVCPVEGAVIEYWLGDDRAQNGVAPMGKESRELHNRVQSAGRLNAGSEERVQLWLSDCAARVMDIFEHYYPSDPSVHLAILAARHSARLADQSGEIGRTGFDREELKPARPYTVSWRKAALNAARNAREEPARLAAESAAAACTGDWITASAAIDAIYALHRITSVSQALAACETEVHWQDQRFIARMLLGKIDDWPLPPAGDETFVKRFNNRDR